MFSGLESIINAIKFVVAFVGNIIDGVLLVVSMMVDYMAAAMVWVGMLPSLVVGFIVAGMSLSALLFMIGRQS